MKTAKYSLIDDSTIEIEYDENAPCTVCGEPVFEASVSGTDICPWCDIGKCRFCYATLLAVKEEIDGGRSIREWRDHIKWHKKRGDKGD